MKTEKAQLVQLSQSTDAVLSKRGVTFVRGQQSFVLSKREADVLEAAFAGMSSSPNSQTDE